MPHVKVKGVANQMQFPDDMDINDIRAFLQKRFARLAVNGESDALSKVEDTASPYNPSLVDKIGSGIAGGLKDAGLISNNYSAQQIGKNVSAIGEFLPGIGDATAGDEFGRAVAQGDKFGMAMAGIGVIPVVGDALKDSIRKARKLVDEIEFKYKSDIAPLQAEYRSFGSPERKAEILKESKKLRQPLDAAKSNLFRLENTVTPKKEAAKETVKPNKTFKGKVFHQTAEDFNEFDLSKSADGTAWFTSDKKNFSDPSSSASAASGKSKILEREVELKKAAGYDDLDKFTIDELIQQGYDGAVLDGDIQVFDPKAIKQLNQSLPMADVSRINLTRNDKKTNQYGDNITALDISKGGKKVGAIEYIDDKDSITILRSDVEDEFQGKGVGTDAYEKLITEQLAKGKTIKSDAIVSPQAEKVYEKLKKKGFNVSKAENLSNVRSGVTTASRESRMKQRGEATIVTLPDGTRTSGKFRIKGAPVYTVKP